MFSEQQVFCNICGKKFFTAFGSYGGKMCGETCFNELEKRKTRCILGLPYNESTNQTD
jgi:hypothetical protein